ncbi:N-acetylglucosamine-6-phosphate deacetylase [Sphingomonas sp. SM33]|uniref:N-acetylglucosamine-6-phosphate deacetylase n=1 Tax=Sphingomonas telluris TaxID=2907998 RepID=A0ABS9VN83_9SPHN|nr:N-acetylglucosamine-6-phosphate deacetylase [Sphingomonas telluris]
MTKVALINGRVLIDGRISEGKAVLVEGNRIRAVTDEQEAGSFETHDLRGGLLVPGFIDTQVNGGGGVLFNDAPTVDTIRTIGAAHRAFGTTGFLPTLISDDLHVIRSGIEAVETAIAQGVPGVLGIHIEGPFLNEHRKGIHDADKIRNLDEEGFQVLTSMKAGRTVVTVAPECTTPEMIARLVGAGVIVSAGHSNGSYNDVRAAMDAGLSGVTHLFNAMSPLGAREPGVVGAALESDATWCGIIVDGHHVSPATLKIALRCKAHDRFMLVTDAMPSVGSASKEFILQGKPIFAKDGACLDEHGRLAGSDLDMAWAVRNAVELLDLPLETALAIASASPAAFLGLDGEQGVIAPGRRADFALLDGELTVRETWIGGVWAGVPEA